MRRPPISWSPTSIVESVDVGKNLSLPLSFVSSENLGDVKLGLTPGLDVFVDLKRSSFKNVRQFSLKKTELTIDLDQDVSGLTSCVIFGRILVVSDEDWTARPCRTTPKKQALQTS